MNFLEAVKHMKCGTHVRRKDWSNQDFFIKWNYGFKDDQGNVRDFSLRDYEADDWEIFVEKRLISRMELEKAMRTTSSAATIAPSYHSWSNPSLGTFFVTTPKSVEEVWNSLEKRK